VDPIEGYEILGELARGGMGLVLRARERESGDLVAIKVMLKASSAPQRKRFSREADAMTRIEHRCVVRLRSSGVSALGPYLVMDLVEGESLQGVLEEGGPLEAHYAARLVADLASAVKAMHAQGVLHRDLKPDNVLVREGEEGVTPLLVDFGLALDTDSQDRLTRTGQAIGTPGFWPPEQALGLKHELGEASDVYGLGAVLYACLCGAPPIEGADLLSLLAATAKGVIRPPSARGVDVPPALESICMRALAFEPQSRHAGAAQLGADLERFLAGELGGRRVGWAPVLGLVLLVILLGAGLLVSGASPGPDSRPQDVPVGPSPSGAPSVAAVVSEVRPATPWTQGLAGGRQLRLRSTHDAMPGTLSYQGRRIRSAGRDVLITTEDHRIRRPLPGLEESLRGRGIVRVWDLKTGRERASLRAHPHYTDGIALSKDGRWLATTGDEPALRLWDTTTWQAAGTLISPDKRLLDLAFSPSDAQIACVGSGGVVHVWSRKTQERRTLPGPASFLGWLDEGRLVTAHRGTSLFRVLDSRTGEVEFEARGESPWLDLHVHSGTQRALTVSWRGDVVLWDLQGKRRVWTYRAPFKSNAIGPTRDWSRGVLVGALGEALALDLTAGKPVGEDLRASRKALLSVTATQDGRFAALGHMHTVSLVALKEGVGLTPSYWKGKGHSGRVFGLSWTEAGLVSVDPGGFWRWGVKDVLEGVRVVFARSRVGTAGLAPSGEWCLIVVGSGSLYLLDPRGPFPVKLGKTRGRVTAIAAAPSGRHALVAFENRPPQHLRLAAGRRLVFKPLGKTPARSVAFSPTGAQAYTGFADGRVGVWDVLEDSFVAHLEGHTSTPISFAIAPTRLFSGDATGNVRAWSLPTGKPVADWEAHPQGPVTALLALDGGERVISAGEDGALSLWSIEEEGARLIERVTLSHDFARSLALGPQGRRFAVGTHRGNLAEFTLTEGSR
jgi:WD40 repeat protein